MKYFTCLKRTTLQGLSILFLALVLLAGCAKEETQPINIGVMADLGAVPIIIAQEKGFFEEEDVEVKLDVFRSALDRDTALQTNNLDGAMADMLTIFFYKEAGVDMKMLSNTYGNYKLVSAPEMDVENFMQIEEKQIGLSSNTVIDFATSIIADEMGFADSLVKVAIPQMPVRLEMLGNGELSGATLPEPLATNAIIDGGSLIGDTESNGLLPAIMIFSEVSMEDKKEEIQSFFIAYNKAVDYLNAADKAEYYSLLVEQLGFSETLADTFEIPKFDYIGAPDEATFDVAQAWMQDKGLIENTYSYDSVTDLNFLPNN